MTLIHVRGILPVLFSAVALPMFARTILVPTQPVSEFADTEVSTNIVMHTSRTDTRDVEIHIQLAGTPTNNLEVAFGRDMNRNGVLEVEEIETVYGWRAGRYFIENACSWERFEAEAATNALCGVVDIQLKTKRGDSSEAFYGHLRGRDGLCGAGDPSAARLVVPRRMEHGPRHPTRGGAAVGVGSMQVRLQVFPHDIEVKPC